MTVSQIITAAARVVGHNVDRENDILPILDMRVKELYDGLALAARTYFDTATGKHPTLNTVAGTYIYDYPTAIQTLLQAGVYLVADSEPENDIYIGPSYISDDSARKLTFLTDPGTTTGGYAWRGVANPVDMDSENDALCIVPNTARAPMLISGIVSHFNPTHPGYGIAMWENQKQAFRDRLRANSRSMTLTTNSRTEFGYGQRETVTDYLKAR